MISSSQIYSLILTISAVLCLITIGVIWGRRKVRSATPLILLLSAIFVWSATYAVHWFLVESSSRLLWLDLTYLGVVAVPACLLIFVFSYTLRDHWLTKKTYLLLAIEPAITIILLFTDPYHGLFFGGKRLETATDIYAGGLWFYINLIYSYALILYALWLLFQLHAQTNHAFRRQTGILLTGMIIPFVGHLICMAGLKPPDLDVTPLLFNLTALFFSYGLLNARLLDLIPIARTTLVETITDGMMVIDSLGRVVDINPAATRILDVGAKEAIGRLLDDVLSGVPTAAIPPLGSQEAQTEIEISAPERRYYDVRAIPLSKKPNLLAGHLLTWRDITLRKKDDFERESLIRELDAYAHTVAHELKTPLSVSLGFLDLLKMDKGEKTPAVTLYIDGVERSSYHALNIVDELLMMAAIRGRQEIPIGPIDMESLVAKALYRTRHAQETDEVTLSLPDEWPPVLGYDPWIEQVWINLLTNARKYGGQPLKIDIRAERQGDGMVRFSLTDNGKGIPLDQQSRLFQQFERLNEYIGSNGHGLGLSIVQRIIEKLNGEVGIDNSEGVGATFYFTLPAAEQ